ncbi:MAG: metallophosphoesterase [Holophagaceae bacterium]|nr:metallophosphoesterase [Holophagaceae bacterium]
MLVLAWISYTLFGLVSTYIVYLGLADLTQFLLRRFLNAPEVASLWALRVAIISTVISVIIGHIQAILPPKIKKVEVPILGLTKGLEGFTIVQISDLHINSMTSMASLELLTNQINELNPNLVAITGDFVDGTVADLLPKVSVMEKLNPKNCVCFVTGNHEYYSGDLQNWLDEFNKMNWCVLMNDNVFIQRNEAKLAVVGIPDSTSISGRGSGIEPNLEKALTDIPKDTPKILLHHKPTNFFEADMVGIALQLSGHTHGGQYFPWSAIVPLFHDFPLGLKRYKRLWMYTSAGTGYWGPPNRFLRPKELTLLVLTRT